VLTLRRTGFSPPIYRDQLDYEVIEDGRAIGRMYEDKHALPEAALVLVNNCVRGGSAGCDNQRSGRDVGGSQGAVCGKLAEVP
jgi:hypothetical protein